jgi:ankyrin repeat protein
MKRFVTGAACIFVILLSVGCEKSPEEARKELISEGIDVNVQTFADSAAAGNERVVQLFLTADQPVNPSNAEGDEVPLIAATKTGRNQVIRTLLDAGADPGINGAEPLSTAASNGNREAVELFLENGSIQSSTEIAHGIIPAVRGEHSSIATLLIRKSDSLESYHIERILGEVSEYGDPDVLKALDSEGYLSEIERDEIIGFATSSSSNGSIENLFYIRENLDYKNHPDWSHITLATKEAKLSDVKQLVREGFKINPDTSYIGGTTPIAVAAREGYSRKAKYLLKNGADPNYHMKMIDHVIRNTAVSGNINNVIIRNSAPIMAFCNRMWGITEDLLDSGAKFEILARVIRVENIGDYDMEKEYTTEDLANECRMQRTGTQGRNYTDKIFEKEVKYDDSDKNLGTNSQPREMTLMSKIDTWAARSIQGFQKIRQYNKDKGYFSGKNVVNKRYGMIIPQGDLVNVVGETRIEMPGGGSDVGALIITSRNNIFFAPKKDFDMVNMDNVR